MILCNIKATGDMILMELSESISLEVFDCETDFF